MKRDQRLVPELPDDPTEAIARANAARDAERRAKADAAEERARFEQAVERRLAALKEEA